MTWHFGISCLHSVVLYQLQKDLHSFGKHTRRSMLSHFENLQIVRRCNCVATREKGRWANGRVRWLYLTNHKSANLLNSRIFRMCGNLRICDLRINQKKFADLKYVDLHTWEIWGFAIADWAQKICGFAICGLLKNICAPTFAYYSLTKQAGPKLLSWVSVRKKMAISCISTF